MQVHDDDRVHQNPEFFVGKQVFITEKLDGGNTTLNQGEVYARSTGQPAEQGWFAHVKKYHAWKTHGMNPDTVLYGEDIAALHSITYNVPMDQTYHIFRVREKDEFLPYDSLVSYGELFDIPVVQPLFRGIFDSVEAITKWFEEEISKPSAFGDTREGFVMSVDTRFAADQFSLNVCKYVRKNHVQTDEHWTKNWTWNNLTSPDY